MGKFLFGLITGSLIMFIACCYHLLYTNDGFYFVPKLQPNLKMTYVDIREFTVVDWAEHHTLVAAILAAKKDQILNDNAAGNIIENAKTLLDQLKVPAVE